MRQEDDMGDVAGRQRRRPFRYLVVHDVTLVRLVQEGVEDDHRPVLRVRDAPVILRQVSVLVLLGAVR